MKNISEIDDSRDVTTKEYVDEKVSGNVGSATKLQIARTINGVSFDGTANITIPRNNKSIYHAGGTEGKGGFVKICNPGYLYEKRFPRVSP